MFNWCSKNKEKDFSDEKPLWNDKIVPVFLPKEPSLKVDPKNEVNFSINGAPYSIKPCDNIGVETSLNTYIRLYAKLPGTKFMCLEGGCGACIVNLRGPDPVSQQEVSWAANSCLTPVYSCDGLSITTIEGVGNRLKGYHALQEKLAKSHGTQCGGCTPGMIMNMFSLLQSSSTAPTMKEIENSFGGNICRCTGYRPILDAFKSFGSDAPQSLCGDIEDLGLGEKLCSKTGKACAGTCSTRTPLRLPDAEGRLWFKVFTVAEIFEVLNNNPGKYMLVHGNTAHGAYRRDPDIVVFVDLRAVKELKVVEFGANLVFGANVTLTNCMKALLTAANNNSADFEYCRQMWKHLDLVLNVPLRNNGTLAGNLMIKYRKRAFPSDLFLLLETVGAVVKIVDASGTEFSVSPRDFLDLDMTKKVITQIILPPLSNNNFIFQSYLVTPRSQNATAYVNAGYLIKINKASGIVEKASIVYGGINSEFIHAEVTEEYLKNKNLYSSATLQGAITTLDIELNPNAELPLALPAYRKNVGSSLFYKFVLNVTPAANVQDRFRSGGNLLERPLTSCSSWPIQATVAEADDVIKCSGEAEFVNDIPPQPYELWAAFAVATKFGAPIQNIDATRALAVPGVRFFLTAADIPGVNSFTSQKIDTQPDKEPIFAKDTVLYVGQPLGMILADSMETAYKAAGLVDVTYGANMKNGAVKKIFEADFKPEKPALTQAQSVSGTFSMGNQFHFPIETLCCVVIPSDEGLDVHCPSEAIDLTQLAIAEALSIPCNKVNVYTKRVGGGFGLKISRIAWIAVACALGAQKTNRPVRFTMRLEDSLEVMGRRAPCSSDYQATFDGNGKIQSLTNTFKLDYGCTKNEPTKQFVEANIENCYNRQVITFNGQEDTTESASNTWCRASGAVEAIAMIENTMEHVARAVGKDPAQVKFANIPDGSDMKTIFPKFLVDVDYYNRRQAINSFNSANRWRKRGIGVVPMRFRQTPFGIFRVTVCIFHGDGSVGVTIGASECGQGLNTKVSQVVSQYLGVPVELVDVKVSDSIVGSNNEVTGASRDTEGGCILAAIQACETINLKLSPLKVQFPTYTWALLVQAAYLANIGLLGVGTYSPADSKLYDILGASCAEIEVDLLTGKFLINRMDILQDVGKTFNPQVDYGQIEGACIMGLGYWLQEKVVFENQTGKLLTNRTWNYFPPLAKDIPVDLRICLMNGSAAGLKAVGEPTFCLTFSAICALRHALDSARNDAGVYDWYSLGAPTTVENIFLSSGNNTDQYALR